MVTILYLPVLCRLAWHSSWPQVISCLNRTQEMTTVGMKVNKIPRTFSNSTCKHFWQFVVGDLKFIYSTDHCALIAELLGDIPKDVALSGEYSHEVFDKQGHLLHIRDLKPWALDKVLKVNTVAWLLVTICYVLGTGKIWISRQRCWGVCEFLATNARIAKEWKSHS